MFKISPISDQQIDLRELWKPRERNNPFAGNLQIFPSEKLLAGRSLSACRLFSNYFITNSNWRLWQWKWIFYDNLSPSQWMMIILIIMQKGWILVFWMPLRHNMPIWMPIWSNSHSIYATKLGTNKVLLSQLDFVYQPVIIYIKDNSLRLCNIVK